MPTKDKSDPIATEPDVTETPGAAVITGTPTEDEGTETVTEAAVSGNLTDAAAAREDAIRRRAYEISESDDSGTPEENWERAERELAAANEH